MSECASGFVVQGRRRLREAGVAWGYESESMEAWPELMQPGPQQDLVGGVGMYGGQGEGK